MTATDLASDGTVIARTLAWPSLGLATAAQRRRSFTALLVSTLAALAFAAVAVPRVDYERAAAAEADASPSAAERSPQEREQALATARKVGVAAGWARAATFPALAALAAATLLFAGFRVAGTRPAFADTFAVAAHGLLPVWLAKLVAIPAALYHAPIAPDHASRLLPSSAAALLPRGAAPPLVAALGAIDLFALWALVLVATGMAHASGASRRRAAAVTAVLYVAWVAVVGVALPAAMAGPSPGGAP